MYLSAGRTCKITFDHYNTSALIFVCSSNKPLLVVYSNGYLGNVCETSDFTATISSDYKTISIKNNTSGGNGVVGVLQSGNMNFEMISAN